MIVSDYDLRHNLEHERLYINPFYDDAVRENGIDFHLGDEIRRAKKTEMLDVKSGLNLKDWTESEICSSFVVNRDESLLCRTVEYLEMPDNLAAVCYLRSTYARLGIKIPATVVDAGFHGTLTVELRGGHAFAVKLYAFAPFMYVIFAKLDSPVIQMYMGKYQGQIAVTAPIGDMHLPSMPTEAV
jgi:dCTP deaminase